MLNADPKRQVFNLFLKTLVSEMVRSSARRESSMSMTRSGSRRRSFYVSVFMSALILLCLTSDFVFFIDYCNALLYPS